MQDSRSRSGGWIRAAGSATCCSRRSRFSPPVPAGEGAEGGRNLTCRGSAAGEDHPADEALCPACHSVLSVLLISAFCARREDFLPILLASNSHGLSLVAAMPLCVLCVLCGESFSPQSAQSPQPHEAFVPLELSSEPGHGPRQDFREIRDDQPSSLLMALPFLFPY
jgi:hypothetical protein